MKRKNISSNPLPSLWEKTFHLILPLSKGKGEVRRGMGNKETSPTLILPLQRRGRKIIEERREIEERRKRRIIEERGRRIIEKRRGKRGKKRRGKGEEKEKRKKIKRKRRKSRKKKKYIKRRI